MEMFREGGSTSRPPMLEGSNYPYWKTKMRVFLKDVDERVWMAVAEGWSPPIVTDEEGDKIKKSSEWTTDEMERANFNSKALHALFNAVSTNQLKVISNCEVAKDAWEKLKLKNEGTDAVKKARLRSLAKSFENLSMEEDESVSEFHAKLCDISNESYALGKTYSNKKLVRKLLGVLPKRFMSKVTSIEESRDIEALDLDELIGSLQNYELTLERWEKGKKTKSSEKEKIEMGVAFIHKEENSKEVDLSESFTDANLALLAKNYARFLRRTSRNLILAECANTLKKKKALAVTWSDSEEEEASDESKDDKFVMAFMVKESVPEEVEGDDSLSDSESTVDEKNKAYEEMFAQWGYMAKRVKELQDLNKALDDSKCELEDKLKKMTLELCSKDSEIYKLTSELVRAKQSLSHVPSGTAALNQALQNQKPYGDRTSIGYKLLYNQGHDLTIEDNSASSSGDKIKFVSASPTIKDDQPEIKPDESKPNSVKRGPMSEKSRVKQVDRFVPTCHFCNKRGHIRPRCYKLRTYLTNFINRKSGQGNFSFAPQHGTKK
ncbi:uncharacterized protein LOC133035979 [Cannabis sativa]|uniref:uncharacterized protein LOC133035979 n=1 Tax=Cannabis sativa TaxID=3483 RepID=UPI0029CAA91B|nr:uncharacterized protein LOC133035979 [Cannabis sativa]